MGVGRRVVAAFLRAMAGIVTLAAVPAFLLFVVGVPWLAGLNPYYAYSDWTEEDTTLTDLVGVSEGAEGEAKLVSAFFGLDGGLLPVLRFLVCPFASGKDGMPVIFSEELDISTVQAGDFRIVAASGTQGEVVCTTFSPASDVGELRTVLLAGEFGSARDQPVTVEIVGNVLSKDGRVNFRGAQADVVPLEDGPRIAMAAVVPEEEWRLGAPPTRLPFGGGSGCPEGTRLVVRVTWEGGVTQPDGSEADADDLALYEIDFSGTDGAGAPVATALADLGDGDNNHLLCFETEGRPVSVRFPPGHFTDPRDDLNPETRALIDP